MSHVQAGKGQRTLGLLRRVSFIPCMPLGFSFSSWFCCQAQDQPPLPLHGVGLHHSWWVIPFPSAFLGNFCSREQPNMLWSIPCAAWHDPVSVTAYFLLFVPSSLIQTHTNSSPPTSIVLQPTSSRHWVGKTWHQEPTAYKMIFVVVLSSFKLLIYFGLHIISASPNIWWFYFNCLVMHGPPAFPLTQASFSYEENEMLDVYFISFP